MGICSSMVTVVFIKSLISSPLPWISWFEYSSKTNTTAQPIICPVILMTMSIILLSPFTSVYSPAIYSIIVTKGVPSGKK